MVTIPTSNFTLSSPVFNRGASVAPNLDDGFDEFNSDSSNQSNILRISRQVQQDTNINQSGSTGDNRRINNRQQDFLSQLEGSNFLGLLIQEQERSVNNSEDTSTKSRDLNSLYEFVSSSLNNENTISNSLGFSGRQEDNQVFGDESVGESQIPEFIPQFEERTFERLQSQLQSIQNNIGVSLQEIEVKVI